jgi:YidC/Oxa1 family membrane protein insertase
VIGSYGFSLLILSIVSGTLIYLLNRIFEKYPKREKYIQAILKPQLARINNESTGSERHERIAALYKRYSYNPILTLRSAIPVFIQLPFLIAAYYMLRELPVLQGVSFLFIEDLSEPDQLLFKINLLPFIMSIINISTAFLSVRFSTKERIQAVIIALVFFVILYEAPSALLIYWTMNNLLFLIRTLIESNASIIESKSSNKLTIRQISSNMKVFTKRNKLDILFKVYLSYLVLFTLYQMLAAVEPLVFLRAYRKLLPFFGITLLLWIVNITELLKNYNHKKNELILLISNIFLIFLGITAILNSFLNLVKVDNDLNLRLQLIFFGFLMFIISFLSMFMRRHKYADSKTPGFVGFLFIVISSIIPAIYLAFNNTDYLAGIYYVFYFAAFIGFALINYYWTVIFTQGYLAKEKVILLSAGFSFLFVALPILRAYFIWNNRIDSEFWILLAVAMLLINFINSSKIIQKLLYIGLIFLLIFSTYNIILLNEKRDKTVFNSDIPEILHDIEFNETPNIYLFVYDGIPNERVFKNENIPFEKLNDLLKIYDFKLYQDTYSLGTASLISMANMLNITGNCSPSNFNILRKIYAGNSIVNRLLRNNSYSTHNILSEYHTGNITHDTMYYVKEIYPPRIYSVDLNFFIILLRSIFIGEINRDAFIGLKLKGFTHVDEQRRKHELIMEPKKKAFIINHYPIPHMATSKRNEKVKDKDKWIKDYEFSINQIEKDFRAIMEYDPESIAIAIGDHGPQFHGYNNDPGLYYDENITLSRVWDMIGTLVAIRWPDREKAANYDYDLILNQDIFPVVFSYMAENDKYLSLKPDRTFNGFKRVFKEGVFLDEE